MVGYSPAVLMKVMLAVTVVMVLAVLMVLTMLIVVMMVNMMMLMLIREGSEAMIGYSPSVLATDRGTGAANSPQRSPHCPQHIKILTILTQKHTFE